jgi:hypothetical protein
MSHDGGNGGQRTQRPLHPSSFTSLDGDNSSGQQSKAAVQARILFCPAEERTMRELHQLPREQREQVWADMSGHPETQAYRMTAESPELIAQQTAAMTEEISRLLEAAESTLTVFSPRVGRNAAAASAAAVASTPSTSYPAFRLAMEQDPHYMEAQKLTFLRAEDFQARPAAQRMLHFFEIKHQLFPGMGMLARDLTWDDLNEDDRQSLTAGGIQVLPKTDHAGRTVVVTRQANYRYKRHENMLRSFMYCCNAMLRSNEKSQKLGFVSVSYQVGGNKIKYDYELTRKVSTLVRVFPVRFVAIYVCYDSSPWKHVADLISHLVSPILRVRLRSVQGSHQECLYQLMSMGIPHDGFPVDNEGNSQLQCHWRWIEHQRTMEESGEERQNNLSFVAMDTDS